MDKQCIQTTGRYYPLDSLPSICNRYPGTDPYAVLALTYYLSTRACRPTACRPTIMNTSNGQCFERPFGSISRGIAHISTCNVDLRIIQGTFGPADCSVGT